MGLPFCLCMGSGLARTVRPFSELDSTDFQNVLGKFGNLCCGPRISMEY